MAMPHIYILGFLLFVSGILLILYATPRSENSNGGSTDYSPPPKTNQQITLIATVMSTFGGLLTIFGTAWYCFVKKNIVKRQPNTHIVVPSEYDSKEPPTAFTDVNFSEGDAKGCPKECPRKCPKK